MAKYFYEGDILQENEITTAPFSLTDIKAVVGAFHAYSTQALAVADTQSTVPILNQKSELTPYYALGRILNRTGSQIDNFAVNGCNSTNVYTRVMFLLVKDSLASVSTNWVITHNNASDFQIVTNIQDYNTDTYYSAAENCLMTIKGRLGYAEQKNVKNHDTSDTNTYRIIPYYFTTVGTSVFIYRYEYWDKFEFSENENGATERTAKFMTGQYSHTNTGKPTVVADYTYTSQLYMYCKPKNVYTLFSDLYTSNFMSEHPAMLSTTGLSLYSENSGSRTNYTYFINISIKPNGDAKEIWKNYGVLFKVGDTTYKPIIQGGIVTGYSDNMQEPSELDDYSDFAHVVPSGSGDIKQKDKIDDMPLGYTSFGNSLVRYYKIGLVGLASLSTALEQIQNGINSIVSLKSYACDSSLFVGLSNSESIRLANTDTGVTADKLQSFTYDYQIGSISINGYHGTGSNPHFLDFAPYTRLECYIPFCGFVELPSHVMYNTIQVYLVGDVTDGTCNGVVKCNGQIVATKAGVIGQSAVFSSTDNATRDNAIISGLLSTAGASLGMTASAGTGNLIGAVGGAIGVATSVTNTINAMNNNYTRITGCNAGKVNNALPDKCYLIRYRTDKVNDDSYKTAYGIPCERTLALSECTGVTIVDNFKVNFSATQTEKDEIKALFKSGVIL